MKHKFLIITLLVIFIIALALGLILPRVINEARLKAMVVSRAREKAKVELVIERLRIHLWPWPGLRLNGITARRLPGLQPSFNFSTGEVNAYINIPSLLRREISLGKITFQDVNLSLPEKGYLIKGDMAVFMHLRAEGPKDKQKVHLKGALDLRESGISMGKKVIKKPGERFIASALITAEKDKIYLEKINLRLKEGELNSNGEITGAFDKETAFNIKAEFKGIAVEDLLAAASKDIIHGRLYGEMALTGRGKDFSAITQTLAGPVHVEIKDGKITTLNLLADILAVAGLLSGTALPPGDYTKLDALKADFKVGGGKAVTDNLWLWSPGLEVKGKGFLTFAPRLDFKLDAYVGTKTQPVAKILGKFLTDSQGRLIVPILVSGEAAKPKVRLDMERVATEALGHQLENLLEKIQKPRH